MLSAKFKPSFIQQGYPLLKMLVIDGFSIAKAGKEGFQRQAHRSQWPTVQFYCVSLFRGLFQDAASKLVII
jgi:hypothetical protein